MGLNKSKDREISCQTQEKCRDIYGQFIHLIVAYSKCTADIELEIKLVVYMNDARNNR